MVYIVKDHVREREIEIAHAKKMADLYRKLQIKLLNEANEWEILANKWKEVTVMAEKCLKLCDSESQADAEMLKILAKLDEWKEHISSKKNLDIEQSKQITNSTHEYFQNLLAKYEQQ